MDGPSESPQRGPSLNRLTPERLKQLGEIQCTPEEAASILEMDVEQFQAMLARDEKARTAFEGGRAGGLEALRRAQFKLAETNATMAIFLGKTYLGQADRRELERSDAVEFQQARQRVRAKIAALIVDASAREARDGG
jgi:hypothetical protein